MKQSERPRLNRWSREQYERLIETPGADATVTPLAAPATVIRVADLLP